MVKMDPFPYKESWRTLAQSPWRDLTAVLHKALTKNMDLAAHTSVWWEAERQWAQAEERKFKLKVMKNFLPLKRIKQCTGCPERLNVLYLWYFQMDKPWTTWSELMSDPAWAGDWTRDLLRSLPDWIILWFYDSVMSAFTCSY